MAFEFPQIVRFQHCDPAGIVFYPRYFEMVNTCVETWFEECLSASYNYLHIECQIGVPTVHIESDFVCASRLEDRLVLRLSLLKLGSKSIDVAIDILAAEELRARFKLTLVLVDLQQMESICWDSQPELLAALENQLAQN